MIIRFKPNDIAKKKTPYHQFISIEFEQPFHPLNRREHFFDSILRFQIYHYYPASKEFHENINYFWIESSDKTEQAIFCITWCVTHWRSKEVSGYQRMIFLSGDVEIFGYTKMLLLEKLYTQKEQEFIERGYDLTLKK